MSTKVRSKSLRITSFTTSGSGSAYTLNIARFPSYTDGETIFVRFHVANANPNPTLSISGLPAMPIETLETPIVAGDVYLVQTKAAAFKIINVSNGATISERLPSVATTASLPTPVPAAGHAVVVRTPTPTIYLSNGTAWIPLLSSLVPTNGAPVTPGTTNGETRVDPVTGIIYVRNSAGSSWTANQATAGGGVQYATAPTTTGNRIVFSVGTDASTINETSVSYDPATNTWDWGTAIWEGDITNNATMEHNAPHVFNDSVTFNGTVNITNGNAFRLEHFVSTAGQTVYTLAHTPVAPQAVWVSQASGLYAKQSPLYDYTITGNIITLNTPASAGDVISVQYVEAMLPISTPTSRLAPVANVGALPVSATTGSAVVVIAPTPTIYLHNGTTRNPMTASSEPTYNGIVTASATINAAINDYIVVTNAASDTTINLPTAVGNNGKQVKIKKLTGEDVRVVTINPVSGQLIDGFTGSTMNFNRTMYTLTAIGGNRYLGD